MHVAKHLNGDQVKALTAAEPLKRRFLRIRAVILAIDGQTAEAIATAVGCSRRSAQNWVAAYNKHGSDGFHDKPKPDRPKLFLDDRLDAEPRPQDGVCTLRGKDIQTILQKKFGVLYTLPGLYDFLRSTITSG